MRATSLSPKFGRPRAPFFGEIWCPWIRTLSSNGSLNYLVKHHTLVEPSVRPRNRIISAIFTRFGRAGFYHNYFIRNLWRYIWRFIVGISSLPRLSIKESSLTESSVDIENMNTDILIIGREPSAVILANEISLNKSVSHLLVYDDEDDLSEVEKRYKIDSNVNILRGAHYLGYFEDGHVFINYLKRKIYVVNSKKIVFATGTRDVYPIFENNDLPGIISSDLALKLLKNNCIKKDHRIAVLGYKERGLMISRLFADAGAEVYLIDVSGSPERITGSEGYKVFNKIDYIKASGYDHVKSLEIRLKNGEKKIIEIDLLITALNRQANIEPLLQNHVSTAYSESLESITVLSRLDGSTDVPNIYVLGSMSGTKEEYIEEEARIISKTILDRELSSDEKKILEKIFIEKKLVDINSKIIDKRPSFYLADSIYGSKFICPCEDVLLEDLVKAFENGYISLEKIKRYTALGTGSCQGRICKYNAAIILSYLKKIPIGSVGLIRQRPPLEPVEISFL